MLHVRLLWNNINAHMYFFSRVLTEYCQPCYQATQHWLIDTVWWKLLSWHRTCGKQIVSVFVSCRWSSRGRLPKLRPAISQQNNMAAPTNHLSWPNQYTSVGIIYGIEQCINPCCCQFIADFIRSSVFLHGCVNSNQPCDAIFWK